MRSISAVLSTILAAAYALPSADKISPDAINIDFDDPEYGKHALTMEKLMQEKLRFWQEMEDSGGFNGTYEASGSKACSGGKAGEYKCSNIDLMSFLPHSSLGSKSAKGNDVWGWTSPDGREFGVVCQWDGTAFVEVKKDGSMIYLGRLNSQAGASQWRDAKVIADHAYIGAESSGSGMQIFDLKQLLDIKPSAPKTWAKEDVVLFKEFGNSHNIVANPATHTIFAAGTGKDLKCKGGLWMVDVKDPKNPKDAGCVAEDGYTHDADCVIYKGPHKQYHGREICFNYNEKQLAIFDVTERSKPKMLSRMTYKDAVYCHQGWIIDPEMKYLAFDDEADENFGWGPAKGGKTITYIVDIQDLTAPKITGYFQSSQKASDHNLYSIGGIVYQSNYGAGLRVIDMRSVVEDPTGKKFQEIGYFDVRPEDDAEGGKPGYVAAWSVYPFFKSGHILINSIERGIFSVKMRS